MTAYNGPHKSQQDEFWPTFTVTCDKCGSHDITLENSMGFSEMSGAWGSIDFVCNACGNRTEIVES
jgi:predicted nucleic acid-binding Zn ribbon protein